MPNKQLPPSWGNPNKSAKPNWAANKYAVAENQTEIISQSKETTESAKKQVQLQVKNTETEIVNASVDIEDTSKVKQEESKDDTISKILDSNPKDESNDVSADKKKSTSTIILVIAMIIVIIAMVIFALLYFCGKGSDKNNTSSESKTSQTPVSTEVTTISPETTTVITSTTEQTETTTTTTTTTTTMSTTSSNKTINASSTAKLDRTYEAIVKSSSTVQVYDSPNYSANVIKTLKSGEKMQVDSYFVDENLQVWFRIKDNKGWIEQYQITCAYSDYFDIMLDIYYSENGEYFTFTHYDIDKDGTDEWLFEKGENYADMEYDVYTANNREAEYLGSIPFGTLYTTDTGELISKIEQMGTEIAYSISLDQDVLSCQLYFKKENVSEYSKSGELLETWMMKDILGEKNNYEISAVELDTTANEWCPNCGYGFFTSGVGTEGFICPECDYSWYP